MPGPALAQTPAPVQAPIPAPTVTPGPAPTVTQPRGNAAAQEALNGGGGEAVQIFVTEIESGGAARAREMLAAAGPGDRSTVEAAVRQALGEEEATALIAEVPVGAGRTPPVEEAPQEEEQEPVEEQTVEETAALGGDGTGGTGGAGGPGGPGQGVAGGPSTSGPAPAPPGANVQGLPTSDLALIHQELIEHQRWSGARTEVGEPGSPERAAFIAERAGEGAISGGLTGMGLGFGMGMVGKLAARFVPIPGVGAILGGAMSVYGLATRDWGQTADTIGRFGEGDSTYELLANSLASVSEIIQLVCDIMNVIAGVIGVISAVMWIVSIITVGLASPLAATLSAIAMGIGAASGVLDLINNLILQPAVLLFRALHTFGSEADPGQVEAQGAGISDASGRAAGALGGWVGGKAGEAAGSAPGDRHVQTTLGEGTAETGPQPQPRTAMPEAPAPTAGDGPTPVAGDGPTPTAGDGPTPVRGAEPPAPSGPASSGPDAPRTDGPDALARGAADAPTSGQAGPETAARRQRGLAALREQFRVHMDNEARITSQRDQQIEQARADAMETRSRELEASTRQRHDEIEADFQRRVQDPEVMLDRHRFLMEAGDAAHRQRMNELDAAGQGFRDASEAASTTFQERTQAIEASRNRELEAVDMRRLRQQLLLMEGRDSTAPEITQQLRQQYDLEHAQATRAIVERHNVESSAAATEYDARVRAASDAQRQGIEGAQTRYDEAMRNAESHFDQSQRQPFDTRHAEVDADAAAQRDAAGDAAATAATPGADATMNRDLDAARGEFWSPGRHLEMVGAAGEALANPQTRRTAMQDLGDAMARSRLDYVNGMEAWRPEWWGKTLGRSGVVDFVLWPFVQDVTMPWIYKDNIAAGPQGLMARSNEQISKPMDLLKDPVKNAISEGLEQDHHPDGKGAQDGEQAATLSLEEGVEVTNTEPVDPRYEEPPGTPEQLDLIMSQIEEALAARAQAEAAELQMTAAGEEHAANQAPIDQCVTETQAAMSAQQAHEEAVARRQQANQQQQQRQQEAQGLLEGYPERAAGLAVIKGPLLAFQGFTHLASKLPGGAGRAMLRMNEDANRMSEAFAQMDGTMSEQAAQQPAQAEALSGDAQRLTAVQEQTGTSRTDLDTAGQGARGLSDANTARVNDAATAREEARSQKDQLGGAIEARQAEHASLQAELTGWALRHREQRFAAQAQTRANLQGRAAS